MGADNQQANSKERVLNDYMRDTCYEQVKIESELSWRHEESGRNDQIIYLDRFNIRIALRDLYRKWPIGKPTIFGLGRRPRPRFS